jgi:hypothetical protein
MKKIIQHDELTTTEAVIDLYISKNSGDGYRATYLSNNHLILKFGATEITIKLHRDDSINNSTNISITDFASTGFTSANASPISNFNNNNPQVATFLLTLEKNQMIDFGVFVKIIENDGTKTILFCDPQASNDPEV